MITEMLMLLLNFILFCIACVIATFVGAFIKQIIQDLYVNTSVKFVEIDQSENRRTLIKKREKIDRLLARLET